MEALAVCVGELLVEVDIFWKRSLLLYMQRFDDVEVIMTLINCKSVGDGIADDKEDLLLTLETHGHGTLDDVLLLLAVCLFSFNLVLDRCGVEAGH